MRLSPTAMPQNTRRPYYRLNTKQRAGTVKTINMSEAYITVEFTEFELTALAALVEKAMAVVPEKEGDYACIYDAIHRVAEEFKSLLGHFAIAA
jgi:hypothetical protein